MATVHLSGYRLWLQGRYLEFRNNSNRAGNWHCTISQVPTNEGLPVFVVLIYLFYCFQVRVLKWWGAGVVICLERGADLNMAQLMPLPLTVSCFSKIKIGFAFLVPAHPGSPGQRAVKRVCVCGQVLLTAIFFSRMQILGANTKGESGATIWPGFAWKWPLKEYCKVDHSFAELCINVEQ